MPDVREVYEMATKHKPLSLAPSSVSRSGRSELHGTRGSVRSPWRRPSAWWRSC
jgi:hypothetical protein